MPAVYEYEWLGPDGNLAGGSSITVGSPMNVTENTTTIDIEFKHLLSSHGGQYTCRVNVTIASLDITDESFINVATVTVQSKCSCMDTCVLTATLNCMYSVSVPPPNVSITTSRDGTQLYAGTTLNYTCAIELNTIGVDGDITVSRAITGLDIDGSRVIVTELVKTTGVTYQTTLMFNPLNTTDSGTYTCSATASVTGLTTPGQASASEHLQVNGKCTSVYRG